jgi:hypothetical protein
VKTKDVIRKQRPALDRLPDGATDDDAWTRVVIPTFINLVLSGDKPWLSSDAELAPLLQEVWDYTYGNRLPFDIKKSTVPFELVCESFISFQILTFLCRRFRSFANTGITMRQRRSRLSMPIFNV